MGMGVESTTMDMALDCPDVWWCPLLLFGFTGSLRKTPPPSGNRLKGGGGYPPPPSPLP